MVDGETVRTDPKEEKDWRGIFKKFLEDVLKDSRDTATPNHTFRANLAGNCRRVLAQIEAEERKERSVPEKEKGEKEKKGQ